MSAQEDLHFAAGSTHQIVGVLGKHTEQVRGGQAPSGPQR